MINNPITSPLPRTSVSSSRSLSMNWRERGVGITHIIFGLVWVVAALLQWLPQFQHTFVAQVTAAKAGPYALLFVMLLCLSAGRYYGLDQWFTSKLGRLGFLASGSFRRIRK